MKDYFKSFSIMIFFFDTVLNSWCFLVISCKVKSETRSINYLYFVTFISLVWLAWKNSLSRQFCKWCIGYLETTVFMSCAYLPNINTFHYKWYHMSRKKTNKVLVLLFEHRFDFYWPLWKSLRNPTVPRPHFEKP